MELKDKIMNDLNISESFISEILMHGPYRVKKLSIKKRDGGYRVVSQPSSKTKVIQYWLINNVLNKIEVHECAMAYRPKTSIYENAKAHISNRFFVKLDLKNFFPSITFKAFWPVLENWHLKEKPDWLLNENARKLILTSCFDPQGNLPVGYPTSPAISNAIMFDFDTNIMKRIQDKDHLGNVVYTRYADDLVFSTNKKGGCNLLLAIAKDEIKKSKHPKIAINNKKVKFSSRSGGSAFITGLRLCSDGHITVHRKYKDKIKLLLSLFAKDELDANDYESLRGHLNYIRYVDAGFYTKLQSKYFRSISKLNDLNL